MLATSLLKRQTEDFREQLIRVVGAFSKMWLYVTSALDLCKHPAVPWAVSEIRALLPFISQLFKTVAQLQAGTH